MVCILRHQRVGDQKRLDGANAVGIQAAGNFKPFFVPGLNRIAFVLDPGFGCINQFFLRSQCINNTHCLGLGGFDMPALGHQFQGRLAPDHSRQALGTTGSRQQADLYFRQSEHGIRPIGCHPVMASESKLQPTTKRGAIDGGCKRFAANLHFPVHSFNAVWPTKDFSQFHSPQSPH